MLKKHIAALFALLCCLVLALALPGVGALPWLPGAGAAALADEGGGGIQPVDEAKVQAKVGEVEKTLYGALKPFVQAASQISIWVAAAVMLLAIFAGVGAAKRALTALAFVALGAALFLNAGKIAAWIMAFGEWIGK